jgi:RNA polymerase sigma-70 factor (ECF subfamily)
MGEGVHNLIGCPRRSAGSADGPGASDAQLLERYAAAHDEAAFEALARRHGQMVLGVCRRVLGDAHEAEDAFQAAFLVLVRRAGEVRKGERLAGWLYGVAQRVAVRARAQAARRRDRERQGVPLDAVQAAGDEAPSDLKPLLHEEINRLPAPYRRPVVLCHLQGKTNEEAARELDCPVGTVKARLRRARALLGSRLAQRGLAPNGAAAPSLRLGRAI